MHGIHWVYSTRCMCVRVPSARLKTKMVTLTQTLPLWLRSHLNWLCGVRMCWCLYLYTLAFDNCALNYFARNHTHTHTSTICEETETAIETKQLMQTHTHARRQMSRIPFESTWKRFAAHRTMSVVVHISCFCCSHSIKHLRITKETAWIPFVLCFLTHFSCRFNRIIFTSALYLPCRFESLVALEYWPLNQNLMKMIWFIHIDLNFDTLRFVSLLVGITWTDAKML